jgi:hypothetical protein
MSNDTCQVAEGTSGGAKKCNRPAVATVTDSKKSDRVWEAHAKEMENTGGSHTAQTHAFGQLSAALGLSHD